MRIEVVAPPQDERFDHARPSAVEPTNTLSYDSAYGVAQRGLAIEDP